MVAWLCLDRGISRNGKGKGILSNVGGQTGKDCLLTRVDGAKVAERRDQNCNLSLRKGCTNHCTTGPHTTYCTLHWKHINSFGLVHFWCRIGKTVLRIQSRRLRCSSGVLPKTRMSPIICNDTITSRTGLTSCTSENVPALLTRFQRQAVVTVTTRKLRRLFAAVTFSPAVLGEIRCILPSSLERYVANSKLERRSFISGTVCPYLWDGLVEVSWVGADEKTAVRLRCHGDARAPVCLLTNGTINMIVDHPLKPQFPQLVEELTKKVRRCLSRTRITYGEPSTELSTAIKNIKELFGTLRYVVTRSWDCRQVRGNSECWTAHQELMDTACPTKILCHVGCPCLAGCTVDDLISYEDRTNARTSLNSFNKGPSHKFAEAQWSERNSFGRVGFSKKSHFRLQMVFCIHIGLRVEELLFVSGEGRGFSVTILYSFRCMGFCELLRWLLKCAGAWENWPNVNTGLLQWKIVILCTCNGVSLYPAVSQSIKAIFRNSFLCENGGRAHTS